MITQSRLHELLSYDEKTGLFTWRNRRGKMLAGSSAGTFCHGYMKIKIDKQQIGSHRLAWLYVHGVWPKGDIDHINRNTADNRIANLREASKAENQQNILSARRHSKSGLLGAYRHSQCDRWISEIRVDGKKIFIGCFDTAEEAHAAYIRKKRELHPFGMI